MKHETARYWKATLAANDKLERRRIFCAVYLLTTLTQAATFLVALNHQPCQHNTFDFPIYVMTCVFALTFFIDVLLVALRAHARIKEAFANEASTSGLGAGDWSKLDKYWSQMGPFWLLALSFFVAFVLAIVEMETDDHVLKHRSGPQYTPIFHHLIPSFVMLGLMWKRR